MGKDVSDNFQDIKYLLTDRMFSIQTVNRHITLHDVNVPVDYLLVFQMNIE